jgi:DNA-binding transcriptional ArsR family regulator
MSPTRRPTNPPRLTVEVSPAYELLLSVLVSLENRDADTRDLSDDWLAEARTRAGDDLVERARALAGDNPDTFTHLIGLVHDTATPRTVDAFLDHLRETDADEIRLHLLQFYSREIRRQTPPGVIRAAVGGDADARGEFLRTSFPEWSDWTDYIRTVLDWDAAAFKAELIEVLSLWADRVWKPESLTIMPILERDAEAKRDLQRDLPLDRFITTATNGVEFSPRPGIDRVVLTPSFVNRPLVTYYEFGDTMLIAYPVADESVSADTDAPPLRLVRLSKALGDDKRLRILRALAEGEKTLMELADMFGVAKTTMHHHMIILRSAGLISASVGKKAYRLRQETIPDVGALLSGYLGAGPGPSAASRSPAPTRRRTGTGG